jgi:hypothetical protein
MSHRTASWLAWTMCALSVAFTALSLLLALNPSNPDTHIYDFWLENSVVPLSFSIICAIIASRLPTNPLGWLYCAAACFSALAHLSAEYAMYALLVQPNSLPAGEVLGWLESWVWILAPGCIVLSLLMFPNGHLPSTGWGWIAWLSVLLTIGGAVWVALSPGGDRWSWVNPQPTWDRRSTKCLQAGPDYHIRALVSCGVPLYAVQNLLRLGCKSVELACPSGDVDDHRLTSDVQDDVPVLPSGMRR